VVEYLLCKCKALSSNTSPTKERKEGKEGEGEGEGREGKKKERVCPLHNLGLGGLEVPITSKGEASTSTMEQQ
jgi:hypothetical protein